VFDLRLLARCAGGQWVYIHWSIDRSLRELRGANRSIDHRGHPRFGACPPLAGEAERDNDTEDVAEAAISSFWML